MTTSTITTFNTLAPIIIQEYERYLPTAFDNNLTMLQKVNKIIQSLTTTNDTVNSLIDQWNDQIVPYVNGDGFQTDVNNKLDAMASDGTLASLISTDILGDLTTLTTNNKTNIVSAVNEVNSKILDLGFDVKNPPSGLSPLQSSTSGNLLDQSTNLQALIDYCVTNHITELTLPSGVYYASNIQSKGVKIKGVSNPQFPFMTWDYASPYGTNTDYQKYLFQCYGTIITTDKDSAIFNDGFIGENIILFGNRRASSSNVGVTSSDASKPFIARNCVILGFGGDGVYLPNGCYQFDIDNRTQILQNGGYGVEFGLNNGSGTGESNFIKIKNSKIERNEKDGVGGKIKGRSIVIKNVGLENNGEPSDPNRPKPTSSSNVVYGVNLEFHNSGGMDNGSIVIDENYSESTYGLVKINAVDPLYGLSIENNFWQPQDQTNYSNFVSLNGWIYGVTVKTNDIYTTHDSVLFETGNNIKNVEIDCPYTGVISQNATPQKETTEDSDKVYLNFNSNGVKSVHNFGSGMATGFTYDSASNSTYINIDSTKISGTVWNGYDMGADSGNVHVGQVVKVGGAYVGVVTAVSSTNHLLTVRNDRSAFALGDGTIELVQVGGFKTINGAGQVCKLIVDYDGTILTTGS